MFSAYMTAYITAYVRLQAREVMARHVLTGAEQHHSYDALVLAPGAAALPCSLHTRMCLQAKKNTLIE
jgi:NADPH-dependent 2,4-dienoyl-CoA reductase/sulfur reductase-like enzyme